MKFGIFYEHQLPRDWDELSEHKLLNDSLKEIELADKLGFDYAWEVEHHFLEEYSHSSAPEVFLAAASQRTRSKSKPLPNLPCAMLSTDPALNATMGLGSRRRVVSMCAIATAPMPPGLNVTRIGVSRIPASVSESLAIRHVRSKPPPGLAGAIHSGRAGVTPSAAVDRESTHPAASSMASSTVDSPGTLRMRWNPFSPATGVGGSRVFVAPGIPLSERPDHFGTPDGGLPPHARSKA